jgi:hypothetical protein
LNLKIEKMNIPVEPRDISGFPSHVVLDPVKNELITQLKDLVRGLSPHGKFPGPNPCSLEKADLKKIRQTDNWLCEKTDGTRVLLACVVYLGTNMCVLVTRAWDVYVIGLKQCPKVWFQGTMFDGELVCLNGQWTWLGFDAMMVSGIPVHTFPLSQRLAAAQRCMKDYHVDPRDPLHLEFKAYFKVFDDYKKYITSATHPIDGTIVTPEHTPVMLGRHTTLFKLKDGGKHTVDFEFSTPDVLKIYDPKKSASVPVGRLNVNVSLTDGSIIEAAWVSGNTWTMVTVRHDKTTSNDMLTYTKTMVNIKENLSLKDLETVWPCVK